MIGLKNNRKCFFTYYWDGKQRQKVFTKIIKTDNKYLNFKVF
jgi:hypothetical protein